MMKRIYAAIALAFIFLLCSCGGSAVSSKNEASSGGQPEKIDSRAAQGFMEHYMSYLVDMNENAKRSFYSSSLLQEAGMQQEQQEPHPAGYLLGGDEASENGRSYDASIFYEVTGKPGFSIDTYSYTLVKEDGTLKIDSISKEESKELIGEGDSISVKKDEEADKKQAVSLDELPEYSVMQRGASPEQKFSVPKDRFTSCGMTQEGDTVIVTTSDSKGNGCFIAKVTIKDEEQAVKQEDEMEGGQKSEDQQAGGQKGQPQQQEKSSGNVKPIDLISDCQANGITFSPEFDKFIVGLLYSDGTKDFRIYDMESGEMVEVDIPILGSQLSSSLPYFISKNQIVFTITPSEGATDDEKSYGGKWEYELESKEFEQIE